MSFHTVSSQSTLHRNNEAEGRVSAEKAHGQHLLDPTKVCESWNTLIHQTLPSERSIAYYEALFSRLGSLFRSANHARYNGPGWLYSVVLYFRSLTHITPMY